MSEVFNSSTSGWTPSSFTFTEHSQTSFYHFTHIFLHLSKFLTNKKRKQDRTFRVSKSFYISALLGSEVARFTLTQVIKYD